MKCFVNKVTPKLFLLQVMNTVRISSKIPDKQSLSYSNGFVSKQHTVQSSFMKHNDWYKRH